MKASFLNKVREVELREIDAPELDADQVLVRVCAVGVCGSDVHYYEHGSIGPFVVDSPLILGHESAGEIVATTSDPLAEEILKVGDQASFSFEANRAWLLPQA